MTMRQALAAIRGCSSRAGLSRAGSSRAGRRSGARWPAAVAVAIVLAPLLAPAAAIASPAAPASPRAASIDPSAVDRFVSDYRHKTGMPGVAVAITHGDRVVYAAGYGRDSTGARITATTRMPVASLSKSFTALAVMQLVEAGKVGLDAPVARYLSDFRLADPRGASVTVRQLLDQTSGMADSAYPDFRRPQADSLAGAVSRLHDAKLATAPGAAFHYYNPNYQVAARLVEVVSGEPFDGYLRRHVFAPLGMRDSTTVDTTRDARGIAHGYIRAYGLPIPAGEPDWFVEGDAGVVTTATDLAQWLIAQNDGGRTPAGGHILSAAGIARTHTPAGPDGYYGLGWEREQPAHGPVEITHNGEWFTYTAQQVLLPGSGYGIAVLTGTGLSIEDDSAVIAQGLVALTQQRTPVVRWPGGAYADWVLAALTLGTVVLGVSGLIRARRWAARRVRRPVWPVAVRLLPYLVPAVVFASLTRIVGFVFANRSGTFLEVSYVWLALVVCLGVAAVLAAGVLVARVAHLVLARLTTARSRSDSPRSGRLARPISGRPTRGRPTRGRPFAGMLSGIPL